MIKHYILTIDPQASHDWDKCTLRNPITGERPDLTKAIAEAVDERAGSYLIAINIEVQILEKADISPSLPDRVELSSGKKTVATTHPKQLLAS